MTIRVGERAPDFRAPTNHGQTLDQDAFRDKLAVVLFFATDPEAPMTQTEIDGWDEHLVDFGHLRVQVLGVLPLPARSVRELSDERSLAVTLLADEAGTLRRDYAVDGDDDATVVVDREGMVICTVPRDDPIRHAATVLRRVGELSLAFPESMEPSADRERPG